MRQLWLEKLAEDGIIRKEAVQHIYNEVKTFVKEAEATMGGVTSSKFSEHLSQLLGGAIVGGAVLGGKAFLNRRAQSHGRDDLMKARVVVIGQYKDPEDIAKAQARFDEIAQYAPHAAMNAPLASKLVRANLHSGISDEMAQHLALLQSQYTKKLSDQAGYLPKTASVRPEVAGEMIADLYIMAKTASFMTGKGMRKFLTTVGTYSAVPIVSGGIAGSITIALDKLKESKLKENMEASFQEAINKAPDVHRDIFKQDAARTREAFDALSHFAPHVALQPHAARTFIKKMLDYYDQGGMNVTDIKELTEIEKNIASSRKPGGFARGFEAGTGFASSGPTFKGIEEATKAARPGESAPSPGPSASLMEGM